MMPMHKTAAALFLLTVATTNATNNSGCYPAWTSGSSYSLGSRVSSAIVVNATNYHRHQELRMQSTAKHPIYRIVRNTIPPLWNKPMRPGSIWGNVTVWHLHPLPLSHRRIPPGPLPTTVVPTNGSKVIPTTPENMPQ